MSYTGNIRINTKAVLRFRSEKMRNKFERVFKNDNSMLKVTKKTEELMREYVPYAEGTLVDSVVVTPRTISYKSEYAHYMYTGVVYGPNIFVPLTKAINANGEEVWNKDGPWGWRSLTGEKKNKTNRDIKYNPNTYDPRTRIEGGPVHDVIHPKATRRWDKAMLREKGKEYRTKVGRIVSEEYKKLNG